MNVEKYLDLKRSVIDAGYADEIDWSETMKPVANAEEFWREFSWVVLNSGMKNQVARGIWERVRPHVEAGGSAHEKFRHVGKCNAIDRVFRERAELFAAYTALPDNAARLDFLRALPWIGNITCWHLAKNYGVDCAKPDRHLVRIFGSIEAVEPACRAIAAVTGERIATVDYVIWRAANLGWV